MAALVIAVVCVISLCLVPLGLPGLWVIAAAAFAVGTLTGGPGLGWITTGGLALLALVAELLEWGLGGRYTRKYGGGRRGAWGAVIGGLVGAVVGVPVPVVGSVIGGFLGAFAGALAGELSAGRERGDATRAATGALVGRAVAVAAKLGIGVAMSVWLVTAALAS